MENNSSSPWYVSLFVFLLWKIDFFKILTFRFSARSYILGNVEEVSIKDWTRIFDVNVRGYALVVKHIVSIMKKQNYGSVVNMASISESMVASNWVSYSVTKDAIIQLTWNLTLDLGFL